MNSEKRGKKIDKKVEKTRTEVREKEEMQLKMCYRSFKKKLDYFFLQLNLHYWSQFIELFVIVISPKELSDNVFNLSVKKSIKLTNICPGE